MKGAFSLNNPVVQGKKKHININKFPGLSRDWVGAKILFVCFFSGHSLWGRKKHINKIPPKIPGQSRENFVYVFSSLCVFSLPSGRNCAQRAANGGSDPSWLNLAFLGRPDFQSRGLQIPIFKGFWDLWTENRGAPKTPNSTTTDLTPPFAAL